MNFIRVLFRHVEKVALMAALTFGFVKGHQIMAQLEADAETLQEIRRSVRSSEEALRSPVLDRDNYAYAAPLPVLPDVRGNLNLVTDDWALPEGKFNRPTGFEDDPTPPPPTPVVVAEMSSPVGITVSAAQKRVQITYQKSVTNEYCRVLEYRVYRTEGATGAIGSDPWRVVRAGDESFTVVDGTVQPKRSYRYWVGAVGMEVPADGKIVAAPNTVAVLREGNVAKWITPPAGPATANVPSDVRLRYKGQVGGDDDARGIVQVQVWDSEIDDWIGDTVSLLPGDRIAGRKLVRRKGIQKYIKIDGRARMVKMGRRTERVPMVVYDWIQNADGTGRKVKRTVYRERTVQFARVLDLDTNSTIELKLLPGK